MSDRRAIAALAIAMATGCRGSGDARAPRLAHFGALTAIVPDGYEVKGETGRIATLRTRGDDMIIVGVAPASLDLSSAERCAASLATNVTATVASFHDDGDGDDDGDDGDDATHRALQTGATSVPGGCWERASLTIGGAPIEMIEAAIPVGGGGALIECVTRPGGRALADCDGVIASVARR